MFVFARALTSNGLQIEHRWLPSRYSGAVATAWAAAIAARRAATPSPPRGAASAGVLPGTGRAAAAAATTAEDDAMAVNGDELAESA